MVDSYTEIPHFFSTKVLDYLNIHLPDVRILSHLIPFQFEKDFGSLDYSLNSILSDHNSNIVHVTKIIVLTKASLSPANSSLNLISYLSKFIKASASYAYEFWNVKGSASILKIINSESFLPLSIESYS